MKRSSRLPDALHDVLVASGRIPPPRRTFSTIDIRPGWDVVDNRDRLIGTVHAVGAEYLVVHRGLMAGTLYVPLSGVGQVHEEVVSLNVDASWVDELGWTRQPRSI